jgi:isocitrate/isopropylmalate dehydrogenase
MRAVNAVLAEGRVRTRDLGGTASTLEYADAICHALTA